jgi:hypothetical protein
MVGYTGGQYNPSSGGSTSGIFIDANAAGAFVLHTPIGIRGISGNFRTNEINSITLLIDSDDVWNFPSNVYFEPDENYLSCGKNIIGLMTYDGGNTWLATVSHRGHGVENADRQCIPGYLFGSCCYTNADGTLEIYDWKRCKEITKINTWNQFATNPLINHMPSSNFWQYALQLNTYKRILEEKYGKKVSKMMLVRIHPDNPEETYELIEVPYLTREMDALFEERKKRV